MPEEMTPRQFKFFSILFIAIALLLIYGQILNHAWLLHGELIVVQDNDYLPGGITAEGAAWAFSNDPSSNWQPLTWISHMMVNTVAGRAAPPHRAVNILFHLANTLLLFHLLCRTTGAMGASAACTALFALHPLQVESVAWVMGRRELLSAFFLMLTILAYIRYCERKTFMRYLMTFVSMGIGLLANAILFVTPVLLLLLDLWPLRRIGQEDTDASRTRVILEKLPLFALALPALMLTSISKELFKALSEGDLQLLVERGTNAIAAGAFALLKILFPWGMAVHYPHQGYEMPVTRVLLSTLVLVAITVLAIRLRKNHPYVIVGWLWFLVLTFPGMYLAPSGTYVMNDHFMYTGLIGIGVAGAWSVDALLKDRDGLRKIIVPATSILIAVMVGFSYVQTHHWERSFSLYRHALKVYPNNAMAHAGMGNVYRGRNNFHLAVRHYDSAINIEYKNIGLRRKLTILWLIQRQPELAIKELEEILLIDPNNQNARYTIEQVRSAADREAKLLNALIENTQRKQE